MSTTPQPTADDLRQAAIAAEQTPPAAPPAETVIDGIKYGKNAEGKFYAELPTGAKYLGANEQELAINISKGKVEADNTLKRWKEEYQPAPAQPAQTAQPSVDPAVEQARKYLLDEIAQGIGLQSGDEFKQYVSMVGATTQNQINENVAAGFQNLCPDFPESDQNNEILLDIAEQNGFPFNPQGLRAAHLIAVADKKYSPLTQEQIRAQKMQAFGLTPETVAPRTPAPMIPSTSPAGSEAQQLNPMDRSVPLDKVREWAMRSQ